MNEIFVQLFTNKYLIVPILTWFFIQTFKVIWDLVTTKKFNFKRILGAGGMPSSHTAVVMSLSTLIGKELAFWLGKILCKKRSILAVCEHF